MTDQANFTFIDLFAGIGGLRKPFEALGGSCVFTSEIDVYAQKTYAANFRNTDPIFGDITKIEAREIPKHDLLLAGFPCQPFSLAGVSKNNSLNRPHGFNNKTKGTLFFEIARILEFHQPEFFLIENVKNLLSHNKGETFKTITHVLTKELGYQISYRVVDAKSFVPQHRERIFIVGFKHKINFDLNKLQLPDPKSGPKLGTILHSSTDQKSFSQNQAYIDKDGKVLPKYTLSDRLWNYLKNYAEKHRSKGHGFGFSVFKEDQVARTLSARYYKDGSEILIDQGRNQNPRRLTPRECARLMGFDKPMESKFIIPVSDTQAYRQFGNSVVVPVVEFIARSLKPYLLHI